MPSTYGTDPYTAQTNPSMYPPNVFSMQPEVVNQPQQTDMPVIDNPSIQGNENTTIPQEKSEMKVIQLNSLDTEKQEEMNERTFGGVDIKQEFMDVLMKLVF